jgi:hypothetical protein
VPKEVFTSTKEENLLHLNSTLNRTHATKFSKRAFCTRKSRELSFVSQERTIEKTTQEQICSGIFMPGALVPTNNISPTKIVSMD